MSRAHGCARATMSTIARLLKPDKIGRGWIAPSETLKTGMFFTELTWMYLQCVSEGAIQPRP
jgi:hypothetical protein